jgi:hypothetical protein
MRFMFKNASIFNNGLLNTILFPDQRINSVDVREFCHTTFSNQPSWLTLNDPNNLNSWTITAA